MRRTFFTLMAMVFAVMPLNAKAQEHDPASPNAESYKGEREDEAESLGKYPNLVRREGKSLFIRYDNRDVVRLDDIAPEKCFSETPCSIWTFLGAMPLKSRKTGKRQEIVVVVYHEGEGGNFVLIDEDGTLLWINNTTSASPSGESLLVANRQGMHNGDAFYMIDWMSPNFSTYSLSGAVCDNWWTTWPEVDEAEAYCAPIKGSRTGPWRKVRLTRNLDRSWIWQEIGVVTNNSNGEKPKVVSSKIKMRTYQVLRIDRVNSPILPFDDSKLGPLQRGVVLLPATP